MNVITSGNGAGTELKPALPGAPGKAGLTQAVSALRGAFEGHTVPAGSFWPRPGPPGLCSPNTPRLGSCGSPLRDAVCCTGTCWGHPAHHILATLSVSQAVSQA